MRQWTVIAAWVVLCAHCRQSNVGNQLPLTGEMKSRAVRRAGLVGTGADLHDGRCVITRDPATHECACCFDRGAAGLWCSPLDGSRCWAARPGCESKPSSSQGGRLP